MLATSPEVQRKDVNKNVEVVSNASICQYDSSAISDQDENGSDENENNQSESSETTSEVTKTNKDDSSSTENLNDSYLADESSCNAISVTEASSFTADDGVISECDHTSARTSPSKSISEISAECDHVLDRTSSIPEISALDITDTENDEQLSETDHNHLEVSKLDSVALNSRGSSPHRSLSTESSPNTSLDQYEEFTSKEIAEAKQAVDSPTEYVPINPDLRSTPEPHSASPIKEVLLTLQKEASKYRNIQVNFLQF
jgi:hypothetical protein